MLKVEGSNPGAFILFLRFIVNKMESLNKNDCMRSELRLRRVMQPRFSDFNQNRRPKRARTCIPMHVPRVPINMRQSRKRGFQRLCMHRPEMEPQGKFSRTPKRQDMGSVSPYWM